METEGAVFIVVTRNDNSTGLKRRTFHMAYVSPRAEYIVLSREAMETLGLVSNLDDRREASVRHISMTPADGGGTSSTPADGGASAPISVARSSRLRQLTDTVLLRQMAAGATLVAALRGTAALGCRVAAKSTSSSGST